MLTDLTVWLSPLCSVAREAGNREAAEGNHIIDLSEQ